MAISLKDINRPMLVLVILANIAFYYAVQTKGFSAESFLWLFGEFERYAPSTILAIIVGVLNAQIDHNNKARLVFLRWKHPLPGSYAFSKLIDDDPRIDPIALLEIQNPLPTDPKDQNRLWFKWYLEFQDEAGIRQAHREYLFTRDWTSISVLILIAFGILAFFQMDWKIAIGYFVLLVGQYLFVRRAAKNHGTRFVSSVLAYKSAKKE